jgi:VIT1/CCC1 family predicted Fe2+/Mn2+ transporter
MTFSPFRASVTGVLAAAAVHYGEQLVTPRLERLGVTDTCNVHLFHGLPGLLGGFLALFGSLYATAGSYDGNLFELRAVFPLMAVGGDALGRSRGAQAVAQLAAICVTLIVAIVGGGVTGIALRFLPDPEAHFHDAETYVTEHVPDTTPSPELREKLESRRRRFELRNKLEALNKQCQEAFERKDAAAARAAHKEEFAAIKEQLLEAREREQARKRKEKKKLKRLLLLAKRKKAAAAAAGKKADAEEEAESKEETTTAAAAASASAVSSPVELLGSASASKKDDGSDKSGESGSDSSSSSSDGDDGAEDLLVHPEPHAASGGDTLKTVVFGALDGIMTTFAVVTAAAGGNQGWKLVVAYGFAHLLADAFSMGFGSYIGDKAELDNAIAERKRESWENKNNPDGEIREMTEIYVNRGFAREDAERLVKIHAKDHERFVDFMMKEELGIDVDIEDEWGPVRGSLVMFWSFVAFGSLPMLPYLSQTGRGVDAVFITSCALVGLGLLGLGALKGALTGLPVLRTALGMLVSGILSGGISYYVGVIVAGKILTNIGAENIGGML